MNPALRSLRISRPARLDWGWPLDIMMAIVILLILGLLATSGWSVAQFKSRSSNHLYAAQAWQARVIEHYALNGDWKFSAGNLLHDFAAGTLAIKSESAIAGVEEGVIVTLGKDLGRREGTVLLSFRPAVPAKAAEQPVVMWLCGQADAPAGWDGPQLSPAAPATNLPDEYLLSICRRRPRP